MNSIRTSVVFVVTVSLAVASAASYLIAATRIKTTSMGGCIVEFHVDERQQGLVDDHGIHIGAFDDGENDKLYVSSTSYWGNGVVTLAIGGTREIEVLIPDLSSSSALIAIGNQFSSEDIERISSYGSLQSIQVVRVRGTFK